MPAAPARSGTPVSPWWRSVNQLQSAKNPIRLILIRFTFITRSGFKNDIILSGTNITI